jgi:translation initiation factor IF-3
LIDENNEQAGIVEKEEALAKAREMGLDLVEVSPMSDPPVCRFMDYGKWLYEQKRKERDAHKKSVLHTSSLKEIRLRPETDKHDLEIKLNHSREFIEKGHKVQFTVFFRGRQVLHREQGFEILEQITQSLIEVAKIERPAQMNGKRMTLLLIPKKHSASGETA